MKTCIRCNNQVNTLLKFCTACGSNEFADSFGATRVYEPAMYEPPPQEPMMQHEGGTQEGLFLEEGVKLRGKYVIGQVLGAGSFGTTYSAWDESFERNVAIKEYLPAEFATRVPGRNDVSIFNDAKKQKQFHDGFVKFLDEGRKISSLANEQGIIHIYEMFEENNTAYMAMEFMEGKLLQDDLGEVDTHMILDVNTTIDFMMPLIQSIQSLHDTNIYHLDIAPNNVFITTANQVKFIDYAAYRHVTTSHSRSLSVIVKPGYSPEELYRSAGDLGAHTDVYAIGALLYRMLTGITPPDAMARRMSLEKGKPDPLQPIRKFNKQVSKSRENAILNALNVRIEDRTQSVTELNEELMGENVKRRGQRVRFLDIGRWPLKIKAAASTVAASLAVVFVLIVTGFFATPFEVFGEGLTNVPNVIGRDQQVALDYMFNNNLIPEIGENEFSSFIAAGLVMNQDIPGGSHVEYNTRVTLTVSNGFMLGLVPHVVGDHYTVAVHTLEDAGFLVILRRDYNTVFDVGHVFEQSVEGNTELALGGAVEVWVSNGRDPRAYVPTQVEVPNMVGMTIAEAQVYAARYGFMFGNVIRVQSNEPATTILDHVPTAGRIINPYEGERVELVVSLGPDYAIVPNVVGMNRETAIRLLVEAGFIVHVEYAYSVNTIAPGNIISITPDPNEIVGYGSIVTIVVSLGRPPFEMPNVVGLSQADARRLLQENGITVSVSFEVNTAVPLDSVIRQTPAAGGQISMGAVATIFVATGAGENLVAVPNVSGQTEASAIAALSNAGLTYNIAAREYNDSVASGLVIRHTPHSVSVPAGSQIQLVVSLGRGITVVPTFTGELGAAYRNLRELGFTAEVIWEHHNTIPEGHIISQSPAPGTSVERGSLIRLTVSDGPTRIVVPDVIGQTRANAQSRMTDVELVVVFDYDYHETIAAGSIMRQNPVAGGEVARGSQVLLTVSQGGITREITFNSNGGGGTMARELVVHNTWFTLPMNRFTAPSAGLVFDGWNTAAAGTGTAFGDGARIFVDDNITLFAQWRVGVEHTITFMPNGGGGAARTYQVASGSSFRIPSYPPFTRPDQHHRFIGWNTLANGQGETFMAGRTIYPTGNMTFHAQWEGPPFVVSLQPNGGTGQARTHDVRRGDNFILPANPFTHPRNYVFEGWRRAPTGGELLPVGRPVSITDNTSFYASWAQPQIPVTHIEGVPTSGQVCTPITLSGTAMPANAGVRSPITWSIVAGTATLIGNSLHATSPGNVTVRARIANGVSTNPSVDFTQDFTINFAGGAPGPITPTSHTGQEGVAGQVQLSSTGTPAPTFTISGAPGGVNITSAGLLSWNANVPSGTHTFTVTADNSNAPAATATFTLTISPTPTVTITFAAGGGSSSMADQTVVQGASFSLPPIGFTPPTGQQQTNPPSWDVPGVGVVNVGGSITVNSDITVTARWEPIPVQYWTVTHDANNGSAGPGPATVRDGQSHTPGTPNPTRGNYTFVGWATTQLAPIAHDAPAPSTVTSITVTNNTTLWAVWRQPIPVQYWTVTHDANNGSGGPGPATVRHDQSHTPGTPNPTRGNYMFVGWATTQLAPIAHDAPIPSTVITSITVINNTTLWAVWRQPAPAPDPPIINQGSATIRLIGPLTTTVTASGNGPFEFNMVGNWPAGVTMSTGGVITVNPNDVDLSESPFTFTITVWDVNGLSASRQFTLTVY